MRNLGLFTRARVDSAAVESLVLAKGGKAGTNRLPSGASFREVQLGAEPNWVYVNTDTSVTNAYFDEEELQELRGQLGFDPQGYISVHFTSSDGGYKLAEWLVREMKALWDGVIDYSGAGGDIGTPPLTAPL